MAELQALGTPYIAPMFDGQFTETVAGCFIGPLDRSAAADAVAATCGLKTLIDRGLVVRSPDGKLELAERYTAAAGPLVAVTHRRKSAMGTGWFPGSIASRPPALGTDARRRAP